MITFLDNQTGVNFLTTDQPIVNTYFPFPATYQEIDKVKFYYPITPKLSVLIHKNEIELAATHIFVATPEVDEYNKMMIKASNSAIFGDSQSIIDRYNGV